MVTYRDYWDDLIDLLEGNLVEMDNERTALVMYYELVSQIISRTVEYKNAGVEQEEMQAQIDHIRQHLETDFVKVSGSRAWISEEIRNLFLDMEKAGRMIQSTTEQTKEDNRMKRNKKWMWISMIAMVFVLSLFPVKQTRAAETVTLSEWSYIISDGVATIKSYNGRSVSVTVPSTMTYGGMTYKLRKIEASAFEGNTLLRSVVIPENITAVGNCAFKNCTNLSSVTINGNVGDCDGWSADCHSSMSCKCYADSTVVAYMKQTGSRISQYDIGKVTISSAVNNSSGIKITWKKTSGAGGYYVYRKGSTGSYKKIKNISGGSTTSWVDKTVKNKNGSTYTYAVKAYNGLKVSASYSAGKKVVRQTTPSITSLKNLSGKKMEVRWKKNSKVSGYEVLYSTSKTFKSKGSSLIKKNTISSKKISSLKKGKTYYVRVRSYKTVSGKKYYSDWSTVKTVKISK